MLINFFGKTAFKFDLIQAAASLLLFADNDFETSTYKRELWQKMLISERKKDETSKLTVHIVARTNEMNEYIYEVQVIDERVDCEDHFTASLFQES